jgi:hypothetical protein
MTRVSRDSSLTDQRLHHQLPPVEVRICQEELTGSASQPDGCESGSPGGAARWWVAGGLFLIVLAAYVLSNPGRIDVVDGQMRFDVAYNWLTVGRPVVRDRWVTPIMGVPGRDGANYSFYGAPASVLSMPLVWLGLHFDPQDIRTSEFLFCLTSSIIGALIAPVLFLFYLELGVELRAAFLWTMVASFATLVWPSSSTTFDNAQHAFFGLSAAYLGFLSSRRDARKLALAGGLMAGILILYQEYFLLIVPALAVSTLDWSALRKKLLSTESREPKTGPASGLSRLVSGMAREIRVPFALVREAFRGPGEARSSCLRCLCFLAGVSVGLLLSFGYNDLRFGSFFDSGKMRNFSHRHPVWGNPLAGLPTLLISPGKSLFLYSPPLVLGILGIRSLWRRRPEAALVIVNASAALVLFMSCYAGLGGDWCWGPRYLTILLPLWALAFPFIPVGKVRRDAVLAIIGAGLLVQAMGLSVETQRFFFERGFHDYFWAEDPWVYFKHSALFARVGETLSLADGPPSTARFFNSAPGMDWYTYTILGPPAELPRNLSPVWMRMFQIYYLPRPWPLWLSWIRPALRPIDLRAWLLSLLTIAAAGCGLIYRGFRKGTAVEEGREIRLTAVEAGALRDRAR